MDGEISIIHSFAHALCTVRTTIVLRTQVAFGVGIRGKFIFQCC